MLFLWLVLVVGHTFVHAQKVDSQANNKPNLSEQNTTAKPTTTNDKVDSAQQLQINTIKCKPKNNMASKIVGISMSALFEILAFLVLIGCLILSIWTPILKDIVIYPGAETKPSPNKETVPVVSWKIKQYSYSRTQAMFWTAIVLFCFIWACGVNNGVTIDFNKTCLILLGIGATTTIMARFIDNKDLNDAQILNRHQEINPSRGFFWDILNDGNTYSIHRFQAFVLNLVYGIVFVNEFFANIDMYAKNAEFTCNIFPQFDEFSLGLLGISAATYITIKKTENKNTAENTAITNQNTNKTDNKVNIPPVDKNKAPNAKNKAMELLKNAGDNNPFITKK